MPVCSCLLLCLCAPLGRRSPTYPVSLCFAVSQCDCGLPQSSLGAPIRSLSLLVLQCSVVMRFPCQPGPLCSQWPESDTRGGYVGAKGCLQAAVCMCEGCSMGYLRSTMSQTSRWADGQNEVFLFIRKLKIKVFNRWGGESIGSPIAVPGSPVVSSTIP